MTLSMQATTMKIMMMMMMMVIMMAMMVMVMLRVMMKVIIPNITITRIRITLQNSWQKIRNRFQIC